MGCDEYGRSAYYPSKDASWPLCVQNGEYSTVQNDRSRDQQVLISFRIARSEEFRISETGDKGCALFGRLKDTYWTPLGLFFPWHGPGLNCNAVSLQSS